MRLSWPRAPQAGHAQEALGGARGQVVRPVGHLLVVPAEAQLHPRTGLAHLELDLVGEVDRQEDALQPMQAVGLAPEELFELAARATWRLEGRYEFRQHPFT